MTTASKVLFIIFQNNLSEDIFTKSLEFAQSYRVQLDVMVVLPTVSAKLEGIVKEFKSSIECKILSCAKKFGLDSSGIKVEYIQEKPYALVISKYLQDNHYDLAIKQAESDTKSIGKLIDIDLIRKINCPIWFCSEGNYLDEDKTVFIAIDPATVSEKEDALNKNLLAYGRLMGEFFNAKISIISCWHCEDEIFLRDSVFANMSEHDVNELVLKDDNNHREHLKRFTSNYDVKDINVHREKGKAYDVIPQIMKSNDLLIMGSVGRSGLSGFFIGNTAEKIFKSVDCSIVVCK